MGKTHLLAIGFGPKDQRLVMDVLEGCVISSVPMDMGQIMEPVSPAPDIVLCGAVPQKTEIAEMAQLVRMIYQQQPVFLWSPPREDLDAKRLVRNGFTGVFCSDGEADEFRKTLTDTLAKVRRFGEKAYHQVKLLDIKAGDTLDFDTFIYLPVNDKYIRYSKAGDPIDPERARHLTNHKMSTIYIQSESVQAFYKYSKDALQGGKDEAQQGITQRHHALRDALQAFLKGTVAAKGTVTINKGKEIVHDSQELVNAFILDSDESDRYLPILNWGGDAFDFFSHTANVASISSALSVALGMDVAEDIAVAGIFHDIGMICESAEEPKTAAIDWSKEELALYGRHGEQGIRFLNHQRIRISDRAMKIIHQYLRCFGDDSAVSADIGADAQILAVVDRIDYMASARAGKKQLSPAEALKEILAELKSAPGKYAVNADLLRTILKFLPGNADV